MATQVLILETFGVSKENILSHGQTEIEYMKIFSIEETY